MLQTMLVSGITPLHSKDELHHWENQPFSGGTWIETSNRKTEITKNRIIKKKTKRVRTAFTTEQIKSLEKSFIIHKYINSENRRELSRKLNIGEKCIKIWFQNRRMKEKRSSSESDTSSDTNGRETVSPVNIQSESDNQQVNDQHTYEKNQYYQPMTQLFNANPKAYEPNSFTPNIEYNNGFTYRETDTYNMQYHFNQSDVNLYQNQYHYNNEMYNWYQDNSEFYNFYQ